MLPAACAILFLAVSTTAQLTNFLPPQSAICTGGDLTPPFAVTSPDACAAACLENDACASFTLRTAQPTLTCGVRPECYPANASSPCPSVLSLSCFGGIFDGVDFAAWGTPTGTCSSVFAQGACETPTAAATVAALCVGKTACVIPAMGSTFGATDPCPGVIKTLAVALHGNCSSAPVPPNATTCTLSGYTRIYTVVENVPDALYYLRIAPRNDTVIVQAIPYVLDVPISGVQLHGGVLEVAFNTGIEYLLGYTVDDLLFNFRKRAGVPQPPGAQCIGWDCKTDWIEGSLAGLFLMGAGGHLRWIEHPVLRSMMDELIDGIENCTEADGYLAAFSQEKLATDEHPDYTTSWTVHGFLEAHIAGNTKALAMIRAHMNVFNNHTLLPTFLPPDGGNWPWQTPLGPFPPGINNATSYTGSTKTGHTIYLIVQGLIHNTRMALSPVGTQADIDLLEKHYIEDWWVEALAARDLTVIGHKLYDAHNYQLTGIEAYMDLYILTGKEKYLDAVMGAWEMHRDPVKGWIHVGGSIAINEGDLYEPGSYWLTGDFPSVHPFKHRDTLREERDHHHHNHQHHPAPGVGGDWGNHPTGEFCGAVFWLKLNQRLHRLWPDNETFVGEIEREMFNEGLGHQGANGVGIRYFSNMNGVKEIPSHIGTCCEGQGTRLYGSLNEYLYSTVAGGSGSDIYVDVYAPSSIQHGLLNVSVDTLWPYDSAVTITVSAAAPSASAVDVALRIPSWVNSPVVSITLNGVANAYTGTPGSYLHISRVWGASDVMTFQLPMALNAHAYTGLTQLPPYQRYAYTFGPVLLAATGPYNTTLNSILIPGVANPALPDAFFVPVAGNFLHWTVGNVLFQPAWEVNADNQLFSAYPAFS
jgi:hypothetical protein